MRYAFYSHGGCENHGCEAIVRTLSAMIKKGQPESVIKLYTLNAGSDEAGDLPNIDETEEFDYIRPVSKTTSAQKIKLSLLSRKSQKLADEYFYSLSCKNPSLKKNDIYISVGGDNYCYGDGHMAAAFNRELKKLGKKTFGYALAVFVVPMGIAIVGIILPYTAVSMSFSVGISIFLYSFSILPVMIVSGISTICFNQHFGAPEHASADTGNRFTDNE